jgi:hypothetical protein
MARRSTGFSRLYILGAANHQARPVQNMCIDHRRRNVAVPEELLHGADVRARLEQVGCEAVPKRVAADGFRDVRLARRVSYGVPQTFGRLIFLWQRDVRGRRKGRNPDRPGPLLTEYASEEYGQCIRSLFHLPSAYSGRGGECGKESLGVVVCREVKRPVGKIGCEPPRPEQIPLQLRIGTPSQSERFTELCGPRFRGNTPVAIVKVDSQGNTSFRFGRNPARTMLYGTGYHHLHPALSKKEHYGPGWAPAPARSV